MGASVLIVGSGGREHALGWKLAQSAKVRQLFFAPGNGGTASLGENLPIEVTEVDKLLDFAKKQKIDLTVVGFETALEAGIVDEFTKAGLKIFGPTKSAAQIETSKAFTADFMERHNIPQPASATTRSLKDALAYIAKREPSEYVIKADGLAGGKGVILPTTNDEAEAAIKDMLSGKSFGAAGSKIVFQERLHGQEVSAFALSDGKNICMLPFFQDHKPIFDDDKGPNTGGIGAYTPVPIVTKEIAEEIRTKIMQATIDGLRKDGLEYRGVLYGGLYVTDKGVKVIEFNARFGDPECEPMVIAMEDDLLEHLSQSAEGRLVTKQAKLSSRAIVNIVLCSGGYPGKYKTGLPITGIEKAEEDAGVVVFHAGTAINDGQLVTSGGRVLDVTAKADNLRAAITKAYEAVKKIHFEDMHYRTDIGAKALK